jgi:Holliday junction resolvase RusA-like endonuclease
VSVDVASRSIKFVVFGRCQAKGSKRVMAVRRSTGQPGYNVVDSNRNAAPWAARIAAKAAETYDGPLLRGPVYVRLRFYFARPRSHFGTGRNARQLKPSAPLRMCVMPDVDKLARCALDPLTGIVFVDDAQVVALNAGKLFGEPERVEIGVRELTG